MKNRVNKAWGKDSLEVYNTNQISDTDKSLFRPQLIQALVVASPALRAQYTSILNKMIATDYPNNWPEFYDLTLNLLQSGRIGEVYAGLMMLLELTKVYRWKTADHRAGLDSVVSNIFPVALQIAGKLLLDPNVGAATMLVLILKAYKSAIAVSLTLAILTTDGTSPSITRRSSIDSLGQSFLADHRKRNSRVSITRRQRR
jgi:importin-7